MELLSPAGSPAALHAAVQNGAGAVYLGYGAFNARRNAKNFSSEEFAAAVSYCHLRGVKVYLTLNTLITDREIPVALETAKLANDLGVDAVLVQDLGLCRLLRLVFPDLPLHASTQMTIHNLPGAQFCASLGLSRVVLSRELSGDDIAHITQNAPVETECFVHGALCMCYSGQCFFSALLGGRSGNRGLCAQPCRLAYRRTKKEAPGHPLSLKDLSLGAHLCQLKALGIACLKLEGRMKRPEYVATVTGIFAEAIRAGRSTTKQEQEILSQIFSRQGFTDGYFTGKVDGRMFGHRPENTAPPEALYAAARTSYEGDDRLRIPLWGSVTIAADAPVQLTLRDASGREVLVEAPIPERARTRPLESAQVRIQLTKTGGTVFEITALDVSLEEGLSLPLSALNALRRAGLEAMTAARTAAPARRYLPATAAWPSGKPQGTKNTPPPRFEVQLHRAAQLSDALLAALPDIIWLPPDELSRHGDAVATLLQGYPGTTLGVALPRIVTDAQLPLLLQQLERCRASGATCALVGNWGLVTPAQALGFSLYGDFGLGVTNSHSLIALESLGFSAATVSFELNLPQIRDLKKNLPLCLLAYGRLPLMLMEHSLGAEREDATLTDRRGEQLPLLPHWGGRAELLNVKMLQLSDKLAELIPLGLSALRLLFTTETADACARVLRQYRQGEAPTGEITRGLYYRKVE